MTFPFLAGTGPNFLNFGKVTKGKRKKEKKKALILVIWNGRIKKKQGFGFGFFSKEAKKGSERKIHEQAGGENLDGQNGGRTCRKAQVLKTETN